MQRIALECQIPTRVASVATQGAMPKWQAEACSITPASSQEIKASKTCVHSPLPVSARIHRKRIGASSVTMYHKIKHSSVKHSLRCLHLMHLVWLCRGICLRYITLAVFWNLAMQLRCTQYPLCATKKKIKPEMLLLAMRCKEMYGGP